MKKTEITLITGPSGSGKTVYATRFGKRVVKLDRYRATSTTAKWPSPFPKSKIYEGALSSNDPLVSEIGISRVILLLPNGERFRASNALKAKEALKRKDWPKRWKEWFKKMSVLTDRQIKNLIENEAKWWKKRHPEVEVEIVKPLFDKSLPVKAWSESN